MVKILLVDDEARLRQAWERLLASTPDVRLVGMLPNADKVLAAIEDVAPDIVLLDLTMPGKDPLEAIREMTKAHPDVRTVVYSARRDPESLREAFDAGAWAFVDKLSSPGDMLSTIQRVAKGEVVFPVHVPDRTRERA